MIGDWPIEVGQTAAARRRGYHPGMPAIRALFLLVGAIIGIVYPFIPAILAGRGFDPAGVGLVTAISAVAFTLAVAVWGHLGDVVLGRVAALRIGVAGSAVAILVLLLDVPPPIVGLLVVIFIGFESSFAPLSDALAVNALAGSPAAYPRIRLLASLGFAIASIAAGRLYDEVGFAPASVLWAAAAVAIGVTLRWVPDIGRFEEAGVPVVGGPAGAAARLSSPLGQPGVVRPGSPLRRLAGGGSFGIVVRSQPRLPSVLLGIGLVQVGVVSGFTFLSLRLIDLGGGPTEIALAAGVSAIAEIPTIWLIPRVIGRVGLRALLVGGILLYGLVMLTWAGLADPALIVGTRVVSGVAFAGISVGAVMTIAALLPPELQATGQGLNQTVSFGLAAIVANAVGGVVYGWGGALPLFLGCAALAGVGAVVTWRAVPARASAGPLRSRP